MINERSVVHEACRGLSSPPSHDIPSSIFILRLWCSIPSSVEWYRPTPVLGGLVISSRSGLQACMDFRNGLWHWTVIRLLSCSNFPGTWSICKQASSVVAWSTPNGALCFPDHRGCWWQTMPLLPAPTGRSSLPTHPLQTPKEVMPVKMQSWWFTRDITAAALRLLLH